MEARSVSVTLFLWLAVAWCGSSEPTAPTDPAASSSATFGDASIDPAVTPTGFLVTLQPSGAVDLDCGEPASVYSASNRTELLGLLSPSETGLWRPNGPDGIVNDACLPEPSSTPATYRIPDELAPGDYILCRGFELDSAGCATFTVVSLADSADPDAVPLTTLPREVEVPVASVLPEQE